MTFGDAEAPLTYRIESWFRAGELTVTGDYDRPLTYTGVDDHSDLIALLNRNPEFAVRTNSSKPVFFWDSTVVGKYPTKCLPYTSALDSVGQRDKVISLLQSSPGVAIKAYAPRKCVEEIFGITKDPETLDDSEIEDLMNGFAPEVVPSETIERPDDFKLQRTYLIVTPNSIYRVGDALPTLIYGGIDDCQVFNTSEEALSSLIMVTVPDGYILAIILSAQDTDSFVTQYCDLGSEGPWRIIKQECDRQFLVLRPSDGLLRFYEFKDSLDFELVNNLKFEDASILDCAFFLNASQSHFLLFVATIQAERLVYHCIEWDTGSPKLKKVHYLTYFTNQEFKRCAPLGHYRILTFFRGVVELVTANQLMSGETNFERFESKFLDEICDTFRAPKLLEKLRKDDQETFGRFEYCMVLGTSSGHINACLVDSADRIQMYSVTRFKGLKGLCAVDLQNSSNNLYDVIIISYGRTLKLTIDISQIKPFGDDSPVISFRGLTFKHTMDSSMEKSSQMVIVRPSKITGRYTSQLWLTSPASMTQIQTNAPTQKLYTICSLQQSHALEKFKITYWDVIAPDLLERLPKQVGSQRNDTYLILGTDSDSSLRCFTLDFSSAEPLFTEIDDLVLDMEDCKELFLTSKSIVQLTGTTVILHSLELNEDPVRFSPDWEIEGAALLGNFVMIWNTKERQVWYTENIDELARGQNFKKTSVFDEALMLSDHGYQAQFQIAKDDHGVCFIYMAGNDGLLQIPLRSLTSDSEKGRLKHICSGRIKSMVCLSKWICFLRNDREIMAVEHSDLSMQSLDFDFEGRDVQLRRVDDDTCLIFSSQEILLFALSTVESWRCWFYDLKLPHQWKLNSILDVQIDKAHDRAFVLFFKGLQVFEMSYFSWNRAKYLLHSTRDLNKKFIFIESINRMLVVNLDSRKWDCIKLIDGKTRSLEASVLQEKCGPPRNVVEVPTLSKEIALLLVFDTMIKLVHLLPQKGNIAVAEIGIHRFDQHLFPSIEVGTDGKVYMLLAKQEERLDGDTATFVEAKLSDSGFSIINEFRFFIQDIDKIRDFKLLGNDLIVNHISHNKIFLLKQIFKRVARRHVEMSILEIPSQTTFSFTYPLNDDSFIAVMKVEKVAGHVSELHFYHRSDINSPVFIIDCPEGEIPTHTDIFEQAIASVAEESPASASASANPTPPDAARGLEDDDMDDMDEMDERDAFGSPSADQPSASPAEDSCPVQDSTTHSAPYRVIKLDKGVKDLQYDPAAQKLYVLASDDSVIVFRPDQQCDAAPSPAEWANSGYEIPAPRPIAQAQGTPSATGPFPIDRNGQI